VLPAGNTNIRLGTMSFDMRWTAYIRTVIIIALLRAGDLYITYIYTPDLGSEWNPLVSLFGFTWYGFVIIQIGVITFISIMMFFYFNRTTQEIKPEGLALQDFCYVYFFGKLRPWPQRMFTFPRHLRPHLVLNGFIFMVVSIGISIFAIINNALLLSGNTTYIAFVEDHHKVYFPSVFTLMIIAALYTFFLKEFDHYKKNCKVKT
jgi:hypothetical protein